MLEKTFKIIKLNHQPSIASSTKTLMMVSNNSNSIHVSKAFPSWIPAVSEVFVLSLGLSHLQYH